MDDAVIQARALKAKFRPLIAKHAGIVRLGRKRYRARFKPIVRLRSVWARMGGNT